MPDNTDNNGINSLGFIAYVESLDKSHSSEMLLTRIIPSFLISMHKQEVVSVTADSVGNWITDMLLMRFKPSTAKRYLGAMRSLYKSWIKNTILLSGHTCIDSDKADVIFSSDILDKFKETDSGAKLAENERNLSHISNLMKVSGSLESHDFVINSIFLYLLFNPTSTVSDVIDLKHNDKEDLNPHTDDIVKSMRKAPQAKYVFPLLQGKRRKHAIIKSLISDLHDAGRRAGMSFGTVFSRESITNIWMAAAIKAGVSISDLVSIVKPLPPLYSFLSAVAPTEISNAEKRSIINRVNDLISDKSPGWFVARLRGGVKPDDITLRLKSLDSPILQQLQLYYPMHKERKLDKKKHVSVDVPVLPGILFFRLPYDKVTPFMATVGDLAWCFRSSADKNSVYAMIPNEEMKTFQRAVGSFTDDIEMELISSNPQLAVGDKVMIEGTSLLSGKKATIQKIRCVDGSYSYTLRLSDTAYIRWKDVRYTASYITKI